MWRVATDGVHRRSHAWVSWCLEGPVLFIRHHSVHNGEQMRSIMKLTLRWWTPAEEEETCGAFFSLRTEERNERWLAAVCTRARNISHCWSAVRRRAVYTVRRRCISFSRRCNTYRARERGERRKKYKLLFLLLTANNCRGGKLDTRARTHMHMLQTMFYYLLPRCLLFLLIISGGSTQQSNTCAALKTKLTKYHVHVKYLPEKTYSPLRLCQTYVNTTCCPQFYADQIQNATVIELYQLFELHSMNLYEPLLRLTQDFNGRYCLIDVFVISIVSLH